jgi:DNA-binding NtrC family response regulator
VVDEQMIKAYGQLEKLGASPLGIPILILGPSGSGKENAAYAVHHFSGRKDGPFVAINCASIAESLAESELFGHEKGAFTGAAAARAGRFEEANGGTLFLDEIGEMPLRQQVALLAVLSNREVTPVGGGKPILVDVRIIAATNRDLRRQVEEGAFREDLFYRLNVIPIEVPPLRERKADIPALVRHFVNEFAGHQARDVPELSTDFLPTLMQSDWPGNVRELQNYIERVMSLHPGRVLSPSPLPRDLDERRSSVRTGRGRRLPDQVEELERRRIDEALSRAHGNQTIAARELGLTEQTLRYRMKKYDVDSARNKRRTRSKLRSRR